jgi:hypothetical protein
MAHMSTARTTSTTSHPTDLPTRAALQTIRAEDLEAMLATDDDAVDTAVIPRLAYRDAVEESAAAVQSVVVPVAEPEPVAEAVAPPMGHSLRSRHATPESVTAIRRNLVAVACVAVAVVLIGSAVTWSGGWVALVAYAVLVAVAGLTLRRANARYAPRHSRYSPRHA